MGQSSNLRYQVVSPDNISPRLSRFPPDVHLKTETAHVQSKDNENNISEKYVHYDVECCISYMYVMGRMDWSPDERHRGNYFSGKTTASPT